MGGAERASVHLEEQGSQVAANPALGCGRPIEPQPCLEVVESVEVGCLLGGLSLGHKGRGGFLGDLGIGAP
jgi:hypothetical protein